MKVSGVGLCIDSPLVKLFNVENDKAFDTTKYENNLKRNSTPNFVDLKASVRHFDTPEF